MAKITKLTAEQWTELYAFREEARTAALTPRPADAAALKPILDVMCDAVGQKRRPILQFSSPLIAILAMPFVIGAFTAKPVTTVVKDSQLGSQLGSQLYSQLGSQLDSQLRSQLGSQLRSQLGSQLRSQLYSQLDSQLYSQLGSQLYSQLGSQLDSQLYSQLGSQLYSQLGSQLDSQLRSQLGSQLGSQLDSQLGSQLYSQLGSQLYSQLGSQLDSQLGSQLDSQLRTAVWRARWGHCEMAWIAFYEAAAKIGVRYRTQDSQVLGWWRTIADNCGWWWPLESCIILAGRPETRWDDQQRLHCETGPAIDFGDGCEVWSWHGVAVPREWIVEKAITPQDALRWENMEQRRAACEILGWDTILTQLKAKTIDKDEDPLIGELVRVKIPDIGEEQFLRVTCGTGRRFALPVPPDMRTALQANAWTYGLDGDVLRQLEART